MREGKHGLTHAAWPSRAHQAGLTLVLTVWLLAGAGPAPVRAEEEAEPDNSIAVEARFFDDSDYDVGVAWEGWFGHHWGARLAFLTYETETDSELIAGNRWRAKSTVGEAALAYRFIHNDTQSLSLSVGLEFGSTEGTNLTTGESAEDTDPVPTAELRWETRWDEERLQEEGSDALEVTYWVVPKVAFYPSEMESSRDEELDFWDTIVGIELGAEGRMSRNWHAYASIIPILAGDNTIDTDTGQTDRSLVWSVGIGYVPDRASRWRIDLGLTNQVGLTSGASLLAAADHSMGISLRLEYGF